MNNKTIIVLFPKKVTSNSCPAGMEVKHQNLVSNKLIKFLH